MPGHTHTEEDLLDLDEAQRFEEQRYAECRAAQGIAVSHGPGCEDDNPCAECRADEHAHWIEEARYR